MSEPDAIAIVGLACRLPSAPDPPALWDLLRAARAATAPVASADFDAGFFGVSPHEAAAIEPQRRLALELTWESLEDAGHDPGRWREDEVGVFVAEAGGGYATLLRAVGADAVPGSAATRIAEFFGFCGASLAVGGGVSASLVAVHMACESLRNEECRLAVAGGVTLGREPGSDGVAGEGGSIVVLRRRADAVADGDRIHAVIRGSAVRSSAGTSSRIDAAERVIRAALALARVESGDIGYVDLVGAASGIAGSPQAAALGRVYGKQRRLAVGSIGANVGDLGAAAGIAGLVKAALCLGRGELVASPGVEDFAADPPGVRAVREREPWPGNTAVAAGVLTVDGAATSCHVVLSPAPRRAPASEATTAGAECTVWVVSARDEPALRAQARLLKEHVEARPELGPADVGWSLATTRARMARRAVVVGADRETLLERLTAVAAGESSPGVAIGSAGAPGKVAFVFPGQGSQWLGMALELWEASEVFAERMDACAAALRAHVDWDLRDVLSGADGAPRLDRTDVVQPVTFAVFVSLAALWRSLGVEPAVVVGHSQGEIAAAHVAGALSLEDAVRVVTLRAGLLARIDGGMTSLSVTASEAQERIADTGLVVGGYNGPRSTVVSGDLAAVRELKAASEAAGERAWMVAIEYPAHSPAIDAIREELLDELAPIAAVSGTIPIFSPTAADFIDGAEMDAVHWYRNEREPVHFEQATRALLADGVTTFVEVSPHPVLTWALRETVQDASPAPGRIGVVGSLRRDEGGLERFLTSVGEAHAGGVRIDWPAVFGGGQRRRVDLPTYAFQRRRYWAGEEPEEEQAPAAGASPALVGLAGAARDATLLELVRAEAASLLGPGSAGDVEPQQAFRELGFDSLTSVELRVRLTRATGLELPATLAFDHPTPAAVAALLGTLLDGGERERRAVRRAHGRSHEPIAIVGMSCRYPGGVTSAQELWDLVAARGDAIGPFPTDRGWDLDRLYDPDPDHAGHSYVRAGGFLYDAADFDAGFFSIAPREASVMDPQQRLVLETAWAALEDAAIDPETLRGSATGVFAGISLQDYGSVLPGVAGEYEGLRLTGSLTSVVSGRIAYALGLQGPAVTVDTACSASLVSLHLACQALRAGECTLALSGGVTVMSSPGMFVEFSRQRGLAIDGRSKPFAAAADGANWAEGVGILVVERPSDARRNGHRVLGLIRGSATNQDGASNGLSAPHGPSQEQVIRQALANAGVEAGDVDVVEAHGTGTRLGDPIEAGALLATYGAAREHGPLRLGSIKSNIGHTQGAAGVAGVIKMVMAMRAQLLPATLHVDAPTPHVDWSAGEISLLTEPVPWPRSARPRRAGVSSFGISGTNAHVVLEEAPAEDRSEPATGVRAVPWVLSAKTEEGLREQARRLRAHVPGRPELDPRDVGWTLAAGRARLDRRAVVVGADRETLLAGLDAVAANEPSDAVALGHARARGKVAFVFPGQGSQWLGMALDLWDAAPVFAAKMEACAEALRPFVGWDLRDVLAGAPGAPALERMDVVQPASFAVFVSLAALWQSYGVAPSVVVGHSQGEIAAAHVAGALGIDDAARVTALRSRALIELSGAGGMMSVFLAADEVRERIGSRGEQLSIASYNGPRSTVVSGDVPALEALLAECEADGVRARMIAVDYASHSRHVDAIRDRLLADLGPITPMSGSIPLLSTTTAHYVDGAQMDAEHWFRNLREPVRFEQAIRSFLDDGVTAFVEASPHPVLTWAVQEVVEDAANPDQVAVVGSLRRGEGTLARFLTSAGEAHAGGVEVDWSPALTGGRRVGLPTYPFQRSRYWLTPGAGGSPASDLAGAGVQAAEHPLLGAAVQLAGRDGWLLTGRLSLARQPWLADHELLDQVLLPGSAFVEIALRAGAEVGCDRVDELVLTAPLVLRPCGDVQLQVAVGEPDSDGRRSIDIHARPDGDAAEWARHATAAIAPAAPDTGSRSAEWPPAGAAELDVDELYDRLADRGYSYGPAFQCVRAAWQLGDTTFAEVALGEDEAADAAAFAIHPALLDAALHAGLVRDDETGQRLAFSWTGVRVHRQAPASLRVRIERDGDDTLRLAAADEQGDPVLSADALITRAASAGARAVERDSGVGALYRIRWTPVAPAAPNGTEPRIAAVGDVAIRGTDPFADLAALSAARVASGTVVVAAPADLAQALALLQAWLAAAPDGAARLAVLTPRAAAVVDGDVPDPDAAAIRGLVRSAQTEHPGRFVSIDADEPGAVGRALAAGEPEVAVRDGAVLVPRLVRTSDDRLPSRTWRLAPERAGAIVAAAPVDGDGDRPLASGEVRVAVRTAGVNFRDVLIAMGVYPGSPELGMEGAGVVLEVGPGVTGLRVGDRIMGFVAGAFGPLAVADSRVVVRMPEKWSFAQSAAVPVAHATARRALIDIARLKPGERVLIHAAAGGVGLAAVGLAQALGAEVFATASPWKWDALRALELEEDHLASSRTATFGARFATTADDCGIDVVLNCLTGELVDASLGLMTRGGRFLELGMTDVRDPDVVAAEYPGVRYARVDLLGAGPQRLGELVGEAVAAIERGELAPPRVTAFDVRRGSEALAFVSQARHIGKVVLSVPRAIDPDGTVLVTGGTDGLGALVAEHLAREHGARHLLLVSRRGRSAGSAGALEERLTALGCEATIASCDVGDRAALVDLLAEVPLDRPLTAVVHAAATSANGFVETLDSASLGAVMRPKSGAARLLDELTRGLDLAAFVLFSSAAGTFGHPGQGNYAAANASLDALAQRRRTAGLPATSVAWGLWQHASGMAGRLSSRDVELLKQSTGQRTLPTAQGLALFDAALRQSEPRIVAVPLDLGALRARARSGELPALLGEVVRAPARRAPAKAVAGGSLVARLAAASSEERDALVLEFVRTQAATALGHPSPDAIEPERSFKELGFDSLGSVVLRNRLAQVTGLTLPSTLVFDHPTPLAMAAFIRAEAEEQGAAAAHVPAARTQPVQRRAAQPAREAAVLVGDPALALPHRDVAAVVDDSAAARAAWVTAAPSANGAAAIEPPSPARRYGGAVLGLIASVVRGLRFRVWVLRTRVRLARVGCRLRVETNGTPRFDELPHIAFDSIGEGRGSLTLRIGRDCRFGRAITLDLWTHTDGVIAIGDRCHFQSRIRLQPWGGAIRLGAGSQVRDGSELKSKGELVIGDHGIIARNVTVHCHGSIRFDERVNLAAGVTVMDSDRTHDGSDTHVVRQAVLSTPVVIESNVFVGTNALVLRGSHIRRNSMVATGAVLTGGEYPEGHLLAGVPAIALCPLMAADGVPSADA